MAKSTAHLRRGTGEPLKTSHCRKAFCILATGSRLITKAQIKWPYKWPEMSFIDFPMKKNETCYLVFMKATRMRCSPVPQTVPRTRMPWGSDTGTNGFISAGSWRICISNHLPGQAGHHSLLTLSSLTTPRTCLTGEIAISN